MADNYNEVDDDDAEDDFKNLRAKAKKADQYERELAQMKRQMAFMQAGVPSDDPRMTYFIKGYDGDLDPEKIREAAVEAGFMAAPQQVVDPAVQQAQMGQQRVLAASNGSEVESDLAGVRYGMEQAIAEGDLDGLSAYTQQFGITFNSEIL